MLITGIIFIVFAPFSMFFQGIVVPYYIFIIPLLLSFPFLTIGGILTILRNKKILETS